MNLSCSINFYLNAPLFCVIYLFTAIFPSSYPESTFHLAEISLRFNKKHIFFMTLPYLYIKPLLP